MQQMSWYETWFGKEYLDLYSYRNQTEARNQIEFLLNILPTSPSLVLDIACGSGRHLIELAKHQVKAIGIDLSETLLAEAQKNALDQGYELTLFKSDMRSLPFENKTFDLTTSFFTSFGYFDSDEENFKTILEWHRVLKNNGFLFIDYLNKDLVIEALETFSVETFNNKQVTQHRFLSTDKQRIEKKIRIYNLDTKDQSEFQESVRLYDFKELSVILQGAGFSITKTFGDFTGLAFGLTSPRLIILAQVI